MYNRERKLTPLGIWHWFLELIMTTLAAHALKTVSLGHPSRNHGGDQRVQPIANRVSGEPEVEGDEQEVYAQKPTPAINATRLE